MTRCAGGTADSRVPSMNAARTRSAFEGQRRYIVALLALASVATASTVNRSYPCCCNSLRVTANSSASRSVQQHSDAEAADRAFDSENMRPP